MDAILQDTLCEGSTKVRAARCRAPSSISFALRKLYKKTHIPGGLPYINTLQKDFDFILQKHRTKENIAHKHQCTKTQRCIYCIISAM